MFDQIVWVLLCITCLTNSVLHIKIFQARDDLESPERFEDVAVFR